MSETIFEPFMDRLSRDIRNQLSESLIDVLKQQSLQPAEQVASSFASRATAPCYQEYIAFRLQQYAKSLKIITDYHTDPLWQGFVLWDNELFFEVHEVVEHAWLKQQGQEKLLLQAMVRAAGVYIKLEYGYREAAGKMASKALPVLRDQQQRLAEYIDPQILIQALERPEMPAPKLLKPGARSR
ncbi:DUF309 domain-containing protein [Desulfogranum japonicum]|uniref:DUF309 domain-containing protein n=1 Tax=Desulfogranum japonicum TaxID=231447 RepID=UPI0004049863|nr:DUF309 domain-containing protein [Desulfogranum japonicum]